MESQVSTNPRLPAPRRAATAPATSHRRQRSLSLSSGLIAAAAAPRASQGSDGLVETLYNHPSVKIISFTANQRHSLDSTNHPSGDKPGTLPASSNLERTIAVGSFRIYRAPGSVAFLSCGSALQPILPRSQCWCIDEANSHFVLQIRRPNYWRIELPYSNEDEIRRGLILREVFNKILLFEKTECPFQRTFTVDLPQTPQTAVKKKPWTPIGKHLISNPFASDGSPPSPSPELVYGKRRRDVDPAEATVTKGPNIMTDEEADLSHLAAQLQDAPLIHREGAEPSAIGEAGSPEAHRVRNTVDTIESTIVVDHDQLGSPLVPQAQETQVEAQIPSSSNREEVLELPGQPGVYQAHPQTQIQKAAVEGSITDPIFCESQGASARTPLFRLSKPQDTDLFEPVGLSGTSSLHEPLKSTVEEGSSVMDLTNASSETGPAVRNSLVEVNHTGSSASSSSSEGVFSSDADEHGQSFEGSGGLRPVNLKMKRRSRRLAGRRVTMPAQLSLTSPPEEPDQTLPADKAVAAQSSTSEHPSASTSTDSFHSAQSWHSPLTPLPPSPPLSRSDSPLPCSVLQTTESIVTYAEPPHEREASDCTITPKQNTTFVMSPPPAPSQKEDPVATESQPSTDDTGDNDSKARCASGSSALTERPDLRYRARRGNISISSRGLSPLPPAADLFSPPPIPPRRQRAYSRLDTLRNLPSTIINKTMEILLSPPSYLVKLMLEVAAKILAGEWKGLVFGFGEGGEKIPVQWDYSDGELSDWDDDYRITAAPFSQRRRRPANHSHPHGDRGAQSSSEDVDHGSWEVD